jgi:16S rRNA (cytosine1402-N4)-methyltransferase
MRAPRLAPFGTPRMRLSRPVPVASLRGPRPERTAGGPPLRSRSANGDDGVVHLPVLPEETLAAFAPIAEGGGWVVDATLGAGGHSRMLLERYPSLRLLGTDQDPEILDIARKRLAPFADRIQLEQARLSELTRLIRKLQRGSPLGWLMDVGASSLQLDRPERGFSFLHDGPLDMRMDPSRERTAADIINRWDETDLADLFFFEGGERAGRKIARAVVDARRRAPFRHTGALADLVERATGRAGGRIHPATKVFQALRRAVNEEGEELRAGLEAAQACLATGGVMVVISFHSGEDGEVKRFLQTGSREGRWELQSKKAVQATREEIRSNSRSRSAKLRAAVRLRDDSQDVDESIDEGLEA